MKNVDWTSKHQDLGIYDESSAAKNWEIVYKQLEGHNPRSLTWIQTSADQPKKDWALNETEWG